MQHLKKHKFIAVLLCVAILMTSLSLDNIISNKFNATDNINELEIPKETEVIENTEGTESISLVETTEELDLDFEEDFITEVTSLDEFANEVTIISEENNLDSDNIYATKRLIVLSNNTFDTFGASSVIVYDNLYVLSYDTIKDCKNAYNSLSSNIDIISVEIDTVMETEENDTEVTESENHSVISEETELKKYLDTLEASKEVKVAVLDTGIDTSNDLFANRVIDLGINLSSTGEENSISDDNGHGTEMAAIIASNSNDMVKIMPIKVANSDGKATILNTYLGIQKAIENEADIINISMNTTKSATSEILTNLITEATGKGILVVVSAGNNSADVKDVAPSNIESAIVVSAVDNDSNFASYSNYGKTVDYCSYGTYGDKTGTSYSAANVTSVIADILSKNEEITILDQYVIDLGDEGFDFYYGNGLVPVNNIEIVEPILPSDKTEETENENSDNNVEQMDIHIMTKEECENDNFWQKYHTDTVVKNVLDYNNDDLSVSSVETLTINPNGGSATHIDGTTITSSTAKTLGSLIAIGETKSFSTGTQTIDIKGTYHFVVAGGAGGSATFTNSSGVPTLVAYGGHGVIITSNSVSINKGTALTFQDGATSASSATALLSPYNNANSYNHIAGSGTDTYYSLNGSTWNTFDWMQCLYGDGGNSSSVSFGSYKIVAAGGGGGATFNYCISGLPTSWSGTQALNGISVPLNTSDNTSATNYYDYEKAYTNIYGGYFITSSGLWDTGSDQYSAGKGYKNGKYGGYGSNAIAGGSCGQNYVSGFSPSYASNISTEAYVQMICDSKTFTINDPTKTGYKFTGWTVSGTGVTQTDNGTSTTFTKSSAGNMTITANWTIESYNVTCKDYLTDKATLLGTASGTKSYNYGTTAKGSDWGTSSPYNNAQYTYTYDSCSSTTVTGATTVYRYWTRTVNKYDVTYIDVIDSTSGKELGRTTKNINYGTTVKGSDLGSSATDNKYYNGYYYVSDTSATVTGNGITVYRIFKLRTFNPTVTINWDDNSNNINGIENGIRPNSVSLSLIAKNHNDLNQTVIVKGNNSVPATTNTWTYTFTELQKYDLTTGEEIVYYVSETQPICLDGSLKYEVEYPDTWEINNLLRNNTEEKNYNAIGTITWKDNNDRYNYRPNSVVVELYQNGKLYDSIKIPEGTTTYEFIGLEKINTNSTSSDYLSKYEYTVVEKDISNYAISYDVYETTTTEKDSAGNTITTTTLHSDITNTFTPGPNPPVKDGTTNTLTIKNTFLSQDGKEAEESDFNAININKDNEKVFVTLKELSLIWEPVDKENGEYVETYDGYSGNEINLIIEGTKTTTVQNLPCGKYEIVIQNDNNFNFKNIEEISTKNAKFSYEDGKYFVTFSNQYEDMKEDLNVNMVLNQWRGYTSQYDILNFFKPSK